MHNVPHAILALIIFGYIIISFQFWQAGRSINAGRGKRAMFLLVGIFVLCALAGYAPSLFNVLLPYETAIHIALVLATWAFVFTNQAAAIMKALR